MEIDYLDEDNFLVYAVKQYEPSQVFGVAELNQELQRFVWIKKLLRRYNRDTEDVNLRLMVNHFVILGNIFNAYALNRMLFFYSDHYTWPQVYSILKFLNMINSNIPELESQEVEEDLELTKKLQEI